MNSRERLLAALHRQPVDRIPFAPLIDLYTLVDMPPEVTRGVRAGYDDLPGLNALVEASRYLACDVLLRHVPVTAQGNGNACHLNLLGQFCPPVELAAELRGDQWIETLSTPRGTLTGVWRFNQLVGWSPHPVRHAVTSHDELNVFHYALECLSAEPPSLSPELYQAVDQAIGDDGIASASLSLSPLMFLIEEVCGVEATYYLLHDHRGEVEAVLAKLHASLGRLAQALAVSPAPIVIQYEDTSTTLMSPTVFRRYCLPCLNEYARIVQATGKVFLVHMCGKLRHLVADIASGEFDGVSDVSPPPTGDLPLDEALASLPGKVVVGGIDPTTFISSDPEAVRAQVADLIKSIKPFRGVVLGSADTMPRGTRRENVQLIRELVDSLGAYV